MPEPFWQAFFFSPLGVMLYHAIAAPMDLLMTHCMLVASNFGHGVSYCFLVQHRVFQMSSFIMHTLYYQSSTYPYLLNGRFFADVIFSSTQLPRKAVWTPGAIVHVFNAPPLPTIPLIPARPPVISSPSHHTSPASLYFHPLRFKGQPSCHPLPSNWRFHPVPLGRHPAISPP